MILYSYELKHNFYSEVLIIIAICDTKLIFLYRSDLFTSYFSLLIDI